MNLYCAHSRSRKWLLLFPSSYAVESVLLTIEGERCTVVATTPTVFRLGLIYCKRMSCPLDVRCDTARREPLLPRTYTVLCSKLRHALSEGFLFSSSFLSVRRLLFHPLYCTLLVRGGEEARLFPTPARECKQKSFCAIYTKNTTTMFAHVIWHKVANLIGVVLVRPLFSYIGNEAWYTVRFE